MPSKSTSSSGNFHFAWGRVGNRLRFDYMNLSIYAKYSQFGLFNAVLIWRITLNLSTSHNAAISKTKAHIVVVDIEPK